MSGAVIGWQISIFISLFLAALLGDIFSKNKKTAVYAIIVISLLWVLHTMNNTYGDLQLLQMLTIFISALINIFISTYKNKRNW